MHGAWWSFVKTQSRRTNRSGWPRHKKTWRLYLTIKMNEFISLHTALQAKKDDCVPCSSSVHNLTISLENRCYFCKQKTRLGIYKRQRTKQALCDLRPWDVLCYTSHVIMLFLPFFLFNFELLLPLYCIARLLIQILQKSKYLWKEVVVSIYPYPEKYLVLPFSFD